MKLPPRWWLTDLRFRQLSVDPRPEFESRPLTDEEKRKYGLKLESFAAVITRIGGFAEMLKVHELKAGDVVYAVDGVERDEIANYSGAVHQTAKECGRYRYPGYYPRWKSHEDAGENAKDVFPQMIKPALVFLCVSALFASGMERAGRCLA